MHRHGLLEGDATSGSTPAAGSTAADAEELNVLPGRRLARRRGWTRHLHRGHRAPAGAERDRRRREGAGQRGVRRRGRDRAGDRPLRGGRRRSTCRSAATATATCPRSGSSRPCATSAPTPSSSRRPATTARTGVMVAGGAQARDRRRRARPERQRSVRGSSNYGWWVDCCAPGRRRPQPVRRLRGDRGRPAAARRSRSSGWATWSGTSFAAPKVAGEIAALKSTGGLRERPRRGHQLLAGPTWLADLGVVLNL